MNRHHFSNILTNFIQANYDLNNIFIIIINFTDVFANLSDDKHEKKKHLFN